VCPLCGSSNGATQPDGSPRLARINETVAAAMVRLALSRAESQSVAWSPAASSQEVSSKAALRLAFPLEAVDAAGSPASLLWALCRASGGTTAASGPK
jgi:hypothetical protein